MCFLVQRVYVRDSRVDIRNGSVYVRDSRVDIRNSSVCLHNVSSMGRVN